MIVTAVQAAKLHLYTVVTDDGRETSIDKTVWEHSGLAEGSSVSSEELEALFEHSQAHRAREKALYYLSGRDYGSGEMIIKLVRAGIDRALAEQTVLRFVETGLIDDRRYAIMLALNMSSRKLYPKRRVAMALREKGFESDVIEEIISQLPDEEEQLALELLRKKRYNGTDEPKNREKALAMLARYGFSYAVSRRALALREEELQDED